MGFLCTIVLKDRERNNLIFYLIYILVGFIFAFMVLKNPDNFLKLFLASIIIGPGAKIEGYPILDEFWIIMLLLGLFLRKFFISKLVSKKNETKNYNIHEKAFMLLTFYFLFQSLRGGVWLEDPRMLRWVFFFIIVLSVNNILGSRPPCIGKPFNFSFNHFGSTS